MQLGFGSVCVRTVCTCVRVVAGRRWGPLAVPSGPPGFTKKINPHFMKERRPNVLQGQNITENVAQEKPGPRPTCWLSLFCSVRDQREEDKIAGEECGRR